MKNGKLGLLVLVTSFIFIACAKKTNPTSGAHTSLQKETPISRKVNALMQKMSLADKVGEMTQLSIDMLCVGEPYNLKDPIELDPIKVRKALVDFRVGSILNNGGHARKREDWNKLIAQIQKIAVEEKTTGIPILYGIDAIHGANYSIGATLFPQQIGLAATWNTKLVKELAAISAYETRACSIPWAFAPVLDVGRDYRWSRFWETFGEDTYLVKKMGLAVFEGMQGNDVANPEKVAACMKHFIGYSFPLSGKDRTSSWIPERQLREYFLPPFRAAIEAGAKTVMINSGDVNGVPVHMSKALLTDLLRDELGFKGVAVTDWEDLHYLVDRHHAAKNYKEAIQLAINAGIDMSMVPLELEFTRLLKELVEEGKVPMSRIDESVERILTVKFELDLFENPTTKAHTYQDYGSKKFAQKALQAALESMTLLKNDNAILPLAKNSKIFLTGPTAHALNALNGSWTGTWQGNDTKWNTPNKKTILEAMQVEFGKSNVSYLPGTSIDTIINIKSAVKKAKAADVAVICIGEFPYTEKPGDIHDITLPLAQLKLVEEIAQTGTPIILVLVEGRPRIISRIEPLAKGVLMAYLPGDEGGLAVARTLSGRNNPAGKLPFTYPRYSNDLVSYDYKGTDKVDKYFGHNAINPQWAFGAGISYTTVEYDKLIIDKPVVTSEGTVVVSVLVKNTGQVAVTENVLLFVSDLVASIAPPNKRLRAFKKVKLMTGQAIRVDFELQIKELAFVGMKNKWVTESGDFEVAIGDQKIKMTLK